MEGGLATIDEGGKEVEGGEEIVDRKKERRRRTVRKEAEHRDRRGFLGYGWVLFRTYGFLYEL